MLRGVGLWISDIFSRPDEAATRHEADETDVRHETNTRVHLFPTLQDWLQEFTIVFWKRLLEAEGSIQNNILFVAQGNTVLFEI